jgi:hypothetical protein
MWLVSEASHVEDLSRTNAVSLSVRRHRGSTTHITDDALDSSSPQGNSKQVTFPSLLHCRVISQVEHLLSQPLVT